MADDNNIASSIMLFTFLINIAAGLTSVLIIDINGNQVFQDEDKGWLPEYSTSDTLAFQDSLNDTINPSAGTLENQGDQSYRVLDLFKVGFITRWLNLINTYMFGVINIFQYLLGNSISSGLHIFLFGSVSGVGFGLLHTLIVALYTYSAWRMWTS